MEPPIVEDHLTEYTRQFDRDLVAIDVVVGKILQVVHSSTLDELHDQHPLGRRDYLGDVHGGFRANEVNLRPFSVSSLVNEVHFFG